MKLRANLTTGPSILFSLRELRMASLLAVLLLTACAPATMPDSVEPEISTPLSPLENDSVVMPTSTPTAIQSQATATAITPTLTEAPNEVPQIVATSRGPHLEATDPSTYTRASGETQLVEFFAFW
jgi:hypothetical protein